MEDGKPDERYGDGLVELMRFRNVISSEDRKRLMADWASEYDTKKEAVDRIISTIRERVSHCDPVQLLVYSECASLQASIGKTSELDYSIDDIRTGEATEYLQSVLVSSENRCLDTNERSSDHSQEFGVILQDIHDMYSLVNQFYRCWGARMLEEHGEGDHRLLDFIMEAQLSYAVRGDRYQVHEIEHLERLLVPHDEILAELFGVSAGELIHGLSKLQYSLSAGRADAWNELFDSCEEYEKTVASGAVWAPDFDPYLGERLFGSSPYDVALVTGWNPKLTQALSFELNSCRDFYSRSDFAGWPILHLPAQKRPFISIGGKSYCFNYYDLFDNIYRVLQKTVIALEPQYGSRWREAQQLASETMVEDMFKRLLPGCSTYRNNYYPLDSSWRKRAENDILVVYDSALIIVEVKAGSFTYTPPITDYEAHINSLKTLVEKPDHQCERTRQYILCGDEAKVYDSAKTPKVTLRKSEIRQIYAFSVTIDDFNEFAAKADKLCFLSLQSDAISISVNDLRTYSYYFTSPLQFLHFLKERRAAAATPGLALNDELDHLGMFICYNTYPELASEVGQGGRVVWHGYRKELDDYFCNLYHSGLRAKKPEQIVPTRILEIITWLEYRATRDRVLLSDFLLSLSFEQRAGLSEQIDHALSYEKKTGGTVVLRAPKPFRCCVFVRQEGVHGMNAAEESRHVYSAMSYNEESDRLQVDLTYDHNSLLTRVDFRTCLSTEMSEEERAELYEQGRRDAAKAQRAIRSDGNSQG